LNIVLFLLAEFVIKDYFHNKYVYNLKHRIKFRKHEATNMDYYHIWADKKNTISDSDWVSNMKGFLDHLKDKGDLVDYKITRCKMGFRSMDIPEWHIIMEINDMAQLEKAFQSVAPLDGELEEKHKSFNQYVAGNIQHALYRDWP